MTTTNGNSKPSISHGDAEIARQLLASNAQPEAERAAVKRLLSTAEGRAAFRAGLLGTPEGVALVRQEFGINVVDRKTDTKPIVAILIPTHKKPENETGQALERMLPVAREVCHPVMRPTISSSVVHWVRNQLLATLYKDAAEGKTSFDYVLFMDDDMVPPPNALSVLLDRKVDIIGAVCTVRQDPPLPNARYYNEANKCFQTGDIDQPGIWKIGAIGTGFLLVSKKALDAIGDFTLSQRFFQKYMGMSEEVRQERETAERKRAAGDHNQFWFEFLKSPYGGGELGEDISFCVKARECGFEIYCDSTIQVGHIGNYAFGLNDYWQYREGAAQSGLVVPVYQPQALPVSQIEVVD